MLTLMAIQDEPPAASAPQSGRKTRTVRPVAPSAALSTRTKSPSSTSAPAVPPVSGEPPSTPLGKQAQVLLLLHRPDGATIAEMMAVTGWMSHSVRGLLSAGIKRKLGRVVTNSLDPERGRVYRITPPALVPPLVPPPELPSEPKTRRKSAAPGPAAAATPDQPKGVRRKRIATGAKSNRNGHVAG